MRAKHLRLILAGLLIFLLRWPSSGQQRIQPVIDPDEVRNGRSPIHAREEWFLRGRRAPAGQSPAALREHAFAQRQAMERAQQGAGAAGEGPLSSGSGSAWQALGPAPLISDPSGQQSYGNVAGRVTAIAVDQSDATGNTVYVGAAYGGVWKSTNAAAANAASVLWAPIVDDQATLSIGAIAVSPGGQTVLVGTGEPNNSVDSYYGLGILRSTNAGSSWTLISNATGAPSFRGLGFSKIAFNTSNPSQVVAAVAHVGAEEGSNINGNTVGLYFSGDGGASWSLATVLDPAVPGPGNVQVFSGSATDVAFNANNGTFYAAYRAHGFYQSSNGGQTWTRLPNQPAPATLNLTNCPSTSAQLASCPLYRGELAFNPATNELFTWFVSSAPADGGIWKTTNGGATAWTQLSDTGIANCGDSFGGCGVSQGDYNLFLAAVPNGGNGSSDLYAGAVNLYKSPGEVGFGNLSHVYGCNLLHVHPDEHAIDFSRPPGGNPAVIYFGNDGGVYRTLNGFGLTGSSASNCVGLSGSITSLNNNIGSLTQFISFSQNATNPLIILGGTQDNGSPASSTADGINTTWATVNLGDGGFNEIDPSGTVLFTANTDVTIQRCATGPNPASCDLNFADFVTAPGVSGSTSNFPDHGDFYTPYILDPANAGRIIIGTCRVWRGSSSNWGPSSFANALSNKLNLNNSGANSACAASESAFVSALAAGGIANGFGSPVIYAGLTGAGSSGGNIWVTTNAAGGAGTWIDRTGGINPNHYNIGSVAVDPSVASGNTAYVTVMGFTGGGGHVFKTTNAGASWQDITSNLPDAPADSVVVDPLNPADLFVGTDVGVFRSTNGGASWAAFGQFFPNVVVNHLRIFNSGGQVLLRASTHGRGVWQIPLGPDFAFAMNNPIATVFPGQSGTFSGTVNSVSGYSSTVALSCQPGVTAIPDGGCAPTPASLTPTASFTLTASGSQAQDYIFNLQGAGSDALNTTHSQSLTLRVVDYSLSQPSQINLPYPATSGSSTFVVISLGQFNQAITFDCASLPAGASCSFNPPSVTLGPNQQANVQVTVSGSNALLGGSYALVIEGLSAGAPSPRTATLNLVVADYSLGTNPRTREIYAGQTANYAGAVSALNGYNFATGLNCAAGATAPPASCLVDGAASEVLPPPANFTLTASDMAIKDYSFNLQGVGGDPGAATRLLSETLRVVDFTASALSSNSITMPQSSLSQPLTFKLTPQGSFDFPVTLDCPAMPAGATCFFNGVAAPATVTFSGQPLTVALTVQTDNAIAPGPYPNLTISATSTPGRPGGAFTQPFSLTVSAKGGSTDLSVSDSSADSIGHAVGAPLTLTFVVNNAGSAVNNAIASVTFPHPVQVESADLAGMPCASAGMTDTVVCDNSGNGFALNDPDSRTLTIVVVPGFERTLTGQIVVSSELPDSNVANNSAGFTRQIRPRPFAIRGLPAILP